MKKIFCVSLLVVLMLSLVACKGNTVVDTPQVSDKPAETPIEDVPISTPVETPTDIPVEQPKEEIPMVEELSYNVSLFDKLMNNEDLVNKNFCVSPYSLKQALLLAYAGAENGSDTQKELSNLLDLIETGKGSVHELERDNRVILTSSDAVKFKVANLALFDESLEKSEKFDGIFVNTLKDYYNAAVEMSDLQSLEIVSKVNKFASDSTEGTISEFIKEPFIENTQLVLLNGVYFLGDWKVPFDANNTYSSIFYGLNGENSVKFMNDTREVKYFENDKFKSISLEYKCDENVINAPTFEMSFYLPMDENTNVVDLFKSLENKEDLFNIEYDYTETIVKLPKFEIETYLPLIDTLIEMGMKVSTNPANMDFANITNVEKTNGFYISDVIQKTYIKVDELGTEASAVTAVIMKATGALLVTPEYKEFIADRPFIYVIRDTYTDTVLFMGIISNL